MGVHHIEEGLSIGQRRCLEAGVPDAPTLGVGGGIEHRDVILVVAFFEELAHPGVGEAEDALEIPTLDHLRRGRDLVAVLGPERMRP